MGVIRQLRKLRKKLRESLNYKSRIPNPGTRTRDSNPDQVLLPSSTPVSESRSFIHEQTINKQLCSPPVQDDPPQTASLANEGNTPQTTSLVVNKPQPILWDIAWGELDESQRQLLTSAIGLDDVRSVQVDISDILRNILEALNKATQISEQNRWSFEFRGRVVVLRDIVAKTIDWISKFKECIDVAVSFDPSQTAIAWGIVSFLLTIALATDQEAGLRLISIESITRLIARSRVYEALYIEPLHWECTDNALTEAVVRLYKFILEVLCLYVKQQEKGGAAKALHTVFNPKEISSHLETFEKLERDVEKEALLCERLYHRQVVEGLGEQYTNLYKLLEESIVHRVDKLHTAVTELQLDNFCTWLNVTNPSGRYNEMLRLHQPGTNSWVSITEQWTNWINPHRDNANFVTVHGIPGAGKSVLAAHLISLIEQIVRQSPREFCVYYFCYHQNTQDETIPILKWVILQLCRKSGRIPLEIYQCFKQWLKPTIEVLLDAIEALVGDWDNLYLVIDALDESQEPWDTLLQTLRRLATEPRFCNLRILVTSREYPKISKKLNDFAISLPVMNDDVQQDIKIFLHEALRVNPNKRFKKWSQDLLDEVEASLLHGAGGMFQWVTCQLDLLRRLHGPDQQVREMLRTLPPTINQIYDRIFSLVSEEDKHFILAVLKWLYYPAMVRDFLGGHAYGYAYWESRSILEAALLILDHGSVYDEEDVHDICGCLIRTHRDGRIELAHYTVREYLESNRALSTTFSRGPDLFMHLTKKVFYKILQKPQTTDLPHWNAFPCFCANLFTTIMRDADRAGLEDLGANPDPEEYVVTPLQVAILKGDVVAIQLLLEAGADPNATGDSGALEIALFLRLRKKQRGLEMPRHHELSPLSICKCLNESVFPPDGPHDLDSMVAEVTTDSPQERDNMMMMNELSREFPIGEGPHYYHEVPTIMKLISQYGGREIKSARPRDRYIKWDEKILAAAGKSLGPWMDVGSILTLSSLYNRRREE
ncbi:hypothetical protein F4810DRAFT_722080 [Camillea tinctor]|nr:hypothetical protein F4810DRAFT_722080 [Camillea tinctor]